MQKQLLRVAKKAGAVICVHHLTNYVYFTQLSETAILNLYSSSQKKSILNKLQTALQKT